MVRCLSRTGKPVSMESARRAKDSSGQLPPDADDPARAPVAGVRTAESGPEDPNKEQLLWQGRGSWKHYIGLALGWAVVALAVLLLGQWLRGYASWLQGPWFATMLALLVLGSGLYLLVRTAWRIYGRRYRLTSQRLFISRGILVTTTDQTELIRVDDVRVRQGVLGRLFSVGDVAIISTDVTDAELVLIGVGGPHPVAEHIREHMRILRQKSLFVERL